MALYGGTTGLIHQFLESFGVTGIAVQARQTAALDEAITSAADPCIVFLESPANPTMMMTDIQRAAETALRHPKRPVIMVDNTFLGPTFQHPLTLGADLVLYSATKYLSGFSDMIAGVAIANDPALIQRIRSRRGMFGNILQPDECWMLDSRLCTVSLRMNRQSKNAQRLAEALHGHPKIRRVLYPTLFDDPEQIRIYKAQCDYPGALFSLDFGSRHAAFTFPQPAHRPQCRVAGWSRDARLPSQNHHAFRHVEAELRRRVSAMDCAVSAGIEDWRDLLADFEQALDTIG